MPTASGNGRGARASRRLPRVANRARRPRSRSAFRDRARIAVDAISRDSRGAPSPASPRPCFFPIAEPPPPPPCRSRTSSARNRTRRRRRRCVPRRAPSRASAPPDARREVREPAFFFRRRSAPPRARLGAARWRADRCPPVPSRGSFRFQPSPAGVLGAPARVAAPRLARRARADAPVPHPPTHPKSDEGQPTIGGGYNLLKRIRKVYSHDERPYHAFLAILIRFRNAELTTEQVRLRPPRPRARPAARPPRRANPRANPPTSTAPASAVGSRRADAREPPIPAQPPPAPEPRFSSPSETGAAKSARGSRRRLPRRTANPGKYPIAPKPRRGREGKKNPIATLGSPTAEARGPVYPRVCPMSARRPNARTPTGDDLGRLRFGLGWIWMFRVSGVSVARALPASTRRFARSPPPLLHPTPLDPPPRPPLARPSLASVPPGD